ISCFLIFNQTTTLTSFQTQITKISCFLIFNQTTTLASLALWFDFGPIGGFDQTMSKNFYLQNMKIYIFSILPVGKILKSIFSTIQSKVVYPILIHGNFL